MKNLKNICIISLLASTLLSSCLKDDENYAIGTSNPETSLYTIRGLYKDKDVALDNKNLSDAQYFKGLVISNKQGNNLPQNYLAVQNTWRNLTRGILIELPQGASFNFGDSVLVNLQSANLSTDNKTLVLKGLKPNQIELLSSDNPVESTSVSISALLADYPSYESTYVDVTADLETEPAAGTPIKGNKVLIDGDNNKLNLFTDPNASFADQVIAPSATFVGIPIQQDQQVQLRIQSYAGMAYPSGKIYPGWPESFENNDVPKGSYNMPAIENNVGFQTGQWHLFQSILGETQGRDRIVSGSQAIRFQQNLKDDALLQMNFDLENGASKVTFWYGSYYTDRSCSFQLEYSVDQGESWTQVDQTITDAHPTSESLTAKQAIFLMNIEGPVRFRIKKLGLGTSTSTVSNGRLGLDEFSVFRSY